MKHHLLMQKIIMTLKIDIISLIRGLQNSLNEAMIIEDIQRLSGKDDMSNESMNHSF